MVCKLSVSVVGPIRKTLSGMSIFHDSVLRVVVSEVLYQGTDEA